MYYIFENVLQKFEGNPAKRFLCMGFVRIFYEVFVEVGEIDLKFTYNLVK